MSFFRTLSISKWLYFEMNVCVLSALVLLFSAAAFSSQAVKTTVSPTSGHWENITFIYPQQMDISSDNPRLPHGCVVIKRPEQKQITVQCQAQIKLVRPASLIALWQQQQARDGYFIFSKPELGAVNVHAQITKVSPGVNPASITPANPRARPVTGIFVKYTTDVRQYTFRDEVTGHLSNINATPNHPFYVTSAQEYKAVGDLSQTDHLINLYGHSITLICPVGKTRHCGRLYHAGQIISVYNLEVYQQHRYFAGSAQILVHNVYKCKVCGQEFENKISFDTHIRRSHSDHQNGAYFTGCRSQECGCRTCQIGSDDTRTHATKKYKCIDCQREFTLHSQLKEHVSLIHDRDIENSECPECGGMAPFERVLLQHIKIQHPHSMKKLVLSADSTTVGFDNLPIESPSPLTPRRTLFGTAGSFQYYYFHLY